MKNKIEILLPGFPAYAEYSGLGMSTVALIHSAQGPVLVDSGEPQSRRGLMAQLRSRGIGPEDVRYLLMTHDVDEAILRSDRIYILTGQPGRITDEIVIGQPKPRAEDFNLTMDFLA